MCRATLAILGNADELVKEKEVCGDARSRTVELAAV